ncbi:1-(5-phosphoribosyl)-5-((5-phosphoribosylamino)methylideneamino)imidazole-4-carboxamide isomerase, partial [Candidatus Bathyarchaeota archaeon]
TAAVNNLSLVKEAVKLYGSEHVAVGIDEKDGKVAVHGWKNKSELDYMEFAKSIQNVSVGALIFTPISVDGTLDGPQTEKIQRLVKSVNIPVIASGGVANLEDFVLLAKTGVTGVVVGTAIYEKKFTVKEALEIVKNAS